jgi:hypothetical protein
LPGVATRSTIEFANDTKNVVQNAARSDWSGETGQIGFDLGNWIHLTDTVEAVGDGRFGILNTERMGTAADFESIKGVSQLWHEGTRNAEQFRRFVVEKPGAPDRLAQERSAFWEGKEPQWWLLNYGNTQGGAFAPRAGTFTIERAAFDMAADAHRLISDKVNENLRSLGILI